MQVRKSDVAHIVNASFPEYRGRKFFVRIADYVTLSDLNWSGGTRSVYRAVRNDGKRADGEPLNALAPWNNHAEGQALALRPGVCVVQHSHFCGSDCGLTIYVHPADAPKAFNTNADPKYVAARAEAYA